MKNYICQTCGTQFAKSETPPKHCPICEDERQYVPASGQHWTTLEELRKSHWAVFQKINDNLYGIGMTPSFAIGQRALLIQTSEGNVLWDCINLLDDTIVDIINSLGGLSAIAISHPHYYDTMVEWSKAFGNIPVYIHEADRQWVMRPDDNLQLWDGDSLSINDELTLFNLGGHFDGGTVLHWTTGANGKGALLSSDILQVVPDQKHVSFMYSYPNLIPLSAKTVEAMTEMIEDISYDRIYGAWWNRNILSDAKQAVKNSKERYIRHLE